MAQDNTELHQQRTWRLLIFGIGCVLCALIWGIASYNLESLRTSASNEKARHEYEKQRPSGERLLEYLEQRDAQFMHRWDKGWASDRKTLIELRKQYIEETKLLMVLLERLPPGATPEAEGIKVPLTKQEIEENVRRLQDRLNQL